jgi:hypothetical protein
MMTLTSEQRAEGRAIEIEAREEAINLDTWQSVREIPPITGAVACALLIGKIFGNAADNPQHLEQGLNEMLSIMRTAGLTFLGGRMIKN